MHTGSELCTCRLSSVSLKQPVSNHAAKSKFNVQFLSKASRVVHSSCSCPRAVIVGFETGIEFVYLSLLITDTDGTGFVLTSRVQSLQ